MKKLNELKDSRTSFTLRYNEIMGKPELTDELRAEANELGMKIETLDGDIKLVERQEALNKRAIEVPPIETEEDVIDVLAALQAYFKTGQAPEEMRGSNGGFLLRGDFLTTTNSAVINKTVENALSVAKSPAQTLLTNLGVTTYSGLNGNFVVPSMAQLNAGFAAETVAVGDASAQVQSLTLAGRRLGAYNTVSKETLNNTNPAIWNGIVQDLQDAYYRAVVADLFDQIQVDALDSSTVIAGATLEYGDLVNLQANVPYDMAKPAYVATPAIAAYLKKTASISNVKGPIWEGPVASGMVDGITAVGTALANADHLIYADFSQAVVGEWGDGIEILVNPYEFDVEGKLKVTVSGMVDTGFKNKRFASWIADVSI